MVKNTPFLIRNLNLSEERKKDVKDEIRRSDPNTAGRAKQRKGITPRRHASLYTCEERIYSLQKDLEFYKSVFKTHLNSALFNLRIKTIKGERVWVDKIKAFTDYQLLHDLDKDDEVLEWMKPIPCER